MPPCYMTLLEMFMGIFEGRMASALQLLGTAFCHTSPRPEGASEAEQSGRKKKEWEFFFKASVNVNVLHFSPKVCSSYQV